MTSTNWKDIIQSNFYQSATITDRTASIQTNNFPNKLCHRTKSVNLCDYFLVPIFKRQTSYVHDSCYSVADTDDATEPRVPSSQGEVISKVKQSISWQNVS
jgi:hypothetical protein